MRVSEMMKIEDVGGYISTTLSITADTSIDMSENQILVLQPTADDFTVAMDFTDDQLYVVVQNDSEYSVVIRTSGRIPLKEYTMTAGQIIKLFALDQYGYVAVSEDVDIGIMPPLGSVEYKLVASDIEASDSFGYSVSMSGDGTKCIVGAYFEDTGGDNAGAAYIYSFDGTTWVEDQKIQASDAAAWNYFGYSVSMNADGTRVVVGSYGGSVGGAAYIFSLDGTWSQDQKIISSDIEGFDHFGGAVSISDDGTKCIVGAHLKRTGGTNSGAAYIFSLDGTWSQDQKIMSSDIHADDYFGRSVSMSGDGTRCLVGAPNESTGGSFAGAAYIFSLDGTWSQEQILYASDAESNDQFGRSISMNTDGTKCIVGAYFEDTGGDNAGAAYIFSLDGTWSQDQKIQSSDIEASDYFGWSVSMSGDGTKCIVGAYGEDTGGDNAGAAYVFSLDGTWSQDQKIQASDGQVGDQFGNSISISSDGMRAVVGAYYEDTGGSYAGAAYIY